MMRSQKQRISCGVLGLVFLFASASFARPVQEPEPQKTKKQRKAEKRSGQPSKEGEPSKQGPRESVAERGATSSSPLALPFKRAWQYLTDEASTLPPSVDDERIYMPLSGG